MRKVAGQAGFAIADDTAADGEAIALRGPLRLDEGAGLLGHELACGNVEDLIQAVQQYEPAPLRQRLLEQGRQPRKAMPLIIIDREEGV